MSDAPKQPVRRSPRAKARGNGPPEVAEQRLKAWYDAFVADRRRRGIHEDGIPLGRYRGDR